MKVTVTMEIDRAMLQEQLLVLAVVSHDVRVSIEEGTLLDGLWEMGHVILDEIDRQSGVDMDPTVCPHPDATLGD